MRGCVSRVDVLDGVGRRTARQILLANVSGALLAAAAGALTGDSIKGQPSFGPTDAVTLVVYLTVSLLVGKYWGARVFDRATRWLREERRPAEWEQRRTLSLPLYYAGMSLIGWLGAVGLWSMLTSVSHPWSYVFRVAASILLGGLTTSALTYLLVEWVHRPMVGIALREGIPECSPAPGLRIKLVAAWAVGADVFLLMVGLTFVGRPAGQPPSPAAIWFIVAAGLVAGTLVVYVAARSLVVPLRELHAAARKVEQGRLDTEVTVNDGGEIGRLQAGFNRMVAGLRERNALQDLFGRHVGEEVARQAMETGVSLGGERREVSVLFVDILGSTELSLRHPPDQVVELLNEFFRTIIRVVAAEGGWVNKFEGDGAMCVFGAPIALPDHAVRALRAARTVRRELLALAAVHPEIDAAVGVSAGLVVAGNVGAEQRYEYTVIGSPVSEAARLTDEAKKRLSRALAGEEVVARAGDEATAWMVADEITLRGWNRPILAYEPAAELPRPTERRALAAGSGQPG